MKKLTVISIIQILAILLLYNKVVEIDDIMSRTSAPEQDTVISADLMRTQAPDNLTDPYSYANEDRLRQIIREELVAHFGVQPGQASQTDLSVAPSKADRADIEHQRELVTQQLEYYSSVGRISDSEMQKLQKDIAKLDATGRTEALRELSRAINSGRLEGRL